MIEKIKNYSELETAFFNQDEIKAKSKQEKKNYRQVFGTWSKINNLNTYSTIGEEFIAKFEQSLKNFASWEIGRGIKRSTLDPQISRLKKIRHYYLANSKHKPPLNFPDHLRFSLKTSGNCIEDLLRKLEGAVSLKTLQLWIAGRALPSEEMKEIVHKIEKLLEIENTTLMSTLPLPRVPIEKILKQTEHGKKLSIRLKKPYSLLTELVKIELEDHKKFKTNPTAPAGMQRNKIWTQNSEGVFRTAEIWERILMLFIGFCHLPQDSDDPMMTGAGICEEKLTLGLLTDENLVITYIKDFMFERSGRQFNNGHLHFIKIVSSLLRKDTGYLFQKPEFSKKLGLSLTTTEWQERCLRTKRKLLNLRKEIRELEKSGSLFFKIGRNPQERIDEILNLQHPLNATTEMLNRMLSDVPKFKYNLLEQAVLYRDIFLLALIQYNPLRAAMFSKMKLVENLRREEDGSWWVLFKREDFKNRAVLRKDYRVMVNRRIWRLADQYVTKYRPRLKNANETDFVFIKKRHTRKTVSPNLDASVITNILKSRTAQYISGSKGFGCHSFRYILATDLIRNHGRDGLDYAAAALHDSPKTAEKYYGHTLEDDYYKPLNAYISDVLENANLDKFLYLDEEHHGGQNHD